MKDYTKWKIPLYVDLVNEKENSNKDNKDNKNKYNSKEEHKTFESLFAAWPLRVVIIGNDFKIKWILHPITNDKDGSFDFNQIKDALSKMVDVEKSN